MIAVICDMDGTLLDTQRDFVPAWDYAGEKQNLSHLGEHIPFVCGMNKAGGWRTWKRGFRRWIHSSLTKMSLGI